MGYRRSSRGAWTFRRVQVEELQESEVLRLSLEGPAPVYRVPPRLQRVEEADRSPSRPEPSRVGRITERVPTGERTVLIVPSLHRDGGSSGQGYIHYRLFQKVVDWNPGGLRHVVSGTFTVQPWSPRHPTPTTVYSPHLLSTPPS